MNWQETQNKLRNTNVFPSVIYGLIIYYLFLVGYIVFTQRTFYADGAHYFLKLLEEKSFIYGDDFSRHYAHYATQFPIVILMKVFHVRNVEILSYVFGFGLYLPQLVSLWLCYSIAKTKNIYFMVFPLIALFGITINLSFMSIHESHVIANIFWPILFYLVLKDEFNWRNSIAVLVLGVIFIRSYESAVMLGFILLVVTALIIRERWRNTSLLTKVVWIILAALFIVSIVIAAHFIIYPRCPDNKADFFSSFLAVLKHMTALLSFVYIVIILVCIFVPNFVKTNFYKYITISLIVSTLFICLIPVLIPSLTMPALQYEARASMTCMLPLLAVLAYLVLKNIVVVPEFAWRKISTLIAILIAGQITWHVLATSQWNGFRQVFKEELNKYDGIVRFEDTMLVHDNIGIQLVRHMAWPWTPPTLSILWSENKDVKTIITSFSSQWEFPFNPSNVYNLPKVEEYGFSFEKYKNTLDKH